MINTAIIYNHSGTLSKDGTGAVEVRITISRKPYYINTGVRVRKKEWKFGQVVNRLDSEDLNNRISAMLHRVNDVVNEHLKNGRAIDIKSLRKRVWASDGRRSDDPEDMLAWCENEIGHLGVASGTAAHYRTSVSRLVEFGLMKHWEDLSVEMIHRYDAFLHSIRQPQTDAERRLNKPAKPLSQATIRNHHKDFRSLLSRAYKFGIIQQNPYDRMRGEIKRGDEERIEFLTADERDRIDSLLVSEGSMLATVRDVFIFQCYTGMAYGDMQAFHIDKCRVEDGRYLYSAPRLKTNVTFYIQLLPRALELVRKYGGQMPRLADQTLNKNLKILADMANIQKRMTTHVGRHTFATWMLSNNVPMERVQKMLGHRRITQTQRYAKVLAADVYGEFDRLMAK